MTKWIVTIAMTLAPLCEAQITFTENPIPTTEANLAPFVATGPDGNLWFIEGNGIKIGKMTTDGVILAEFAIPSSGIYGNGSGAAAIVAGPDGNMWFPEYFANKIGRITTTGVITEFDIPDSGYYGNGTFPTGIAVGSDGNLWFTEYLSNKIGQITTAGVITEFAVPSGGFYGAISITAGSDGNLWFTECRCSSGSTGPMNIGRITTAGAITEFLVPTADSYPYGITTGPDGNLWFAEEGGNRIGRITTAGVITEFPVLTPASDPLWITTGPDGNLWFTEETGNKIGQITTSGIVLGEFPIPTSNSTPFGIITGPDNNLWFVETSAKNITRAIIAHPDLTISKTHSGVFVQGQVGTYRITVRNAGNGPTTGSVAMADQLPAGLTALSVSGSGWTCHTSTVSCTRSDVLAAGASYPLITLQVVIGTATPSVVNTVTVSGGGESNTANDTATDPTNIIRIVQVTIATSPAGLKILVDGTFYIAPRTFTWDVGDIHTISASSQGGHVFSSWSDGGAGLHNITVPSSDATYTATFH